MIHVSLLIIDSLRTEDWGLLTEDWELGDNEVRVVLDFIARCGLKDCRLPDWGLRTYHTRDDC